MKQFLKVLTLVFLAVILFAAGWIYCAGMGVEKTALNQSYYRGILEKTEAIDTLYEVLELQLTEQIHKDMSKEKPEDDPVGMPGDVMPEKLTEILVGSVVKAFHREWLREQFLLATGDLTSWLKGKQDNPTLAIALRENREILKDELITGFEELAADIGTLPHPDGVESMVEEILQEMDLPEEIALADLLSEKITPELENKIANARLIRSYFLYIPYILFGLLLLFNFLLAGIAGGLKWFGATALFSGATFIIGLHTARSLLLIPNIRGMDMEIPGALDTITTLAVYTVSRLTTVPLILAGLGLLLLVTGIVLSKSKKKPTG